MRRILIASAVGIALFAIVAYAATLNVGFATAATGSGPVGSCGDVTGSTFILVGQSIAASGQNDTVTGAPTDIEHAFAVNIETVAACDQINAFIAVKNSGGGVMATGSCEINAAGGPNGGTHDDGLGFNEAGTGDNVPGCTAVFSGGATPNVGDIYFLQVTMT
jgi:hypothetical protein